MSNQLSEADAQQIAAYQEEYALRLAAEQQQMVDSISQAQAELVALGLSSEAIKKLSGYPYPFTLDREPTDEEISQSQSALLNAAQAKSATEANIAKVPVLEAAVDDLIVAVVGA